MAAIEGVVHAREIAPDGRVSRIDLAHCAKPAAGWRLIALGGDSLSARSWLMRDSGLTENAVGALLEEDTRPRCVEMEDGALLILRGVDLRPDGGLGRMVSIRLFATSERLLVVQRRRMEAFEKRVAALDSGEDTESVGAFIGGLVATMRQEVEPLLDRLETAVDAFELHALETESPPSHAQRQRLNASRRSAVLLRRYLAPQAEAVRRLSALREPWVDDAILREALSEEADHFRRAAEDLDVLRGRAVIVTEEAALRVAEETNQRLLTLSVVSLIFLPLTFLTGLLGVNLDGIPFADRSWSFEAFAVSTVAAGLLLALFLRWRRLL
jgi:zinc transporter